MITGNLEDIKIREVVDELNKFLVQKRIDCDMHLFGKRAGVSYVLMLHENYVDGSILSFVNRKTGFTFRWHGVDSLRANHEIGIRLEERQDPEKTKNVIKALKMIILMKKKLVYEEV